MATLVYSRNQKDSPGIPDFAKNQRCLLEVSPGQSYGHVGSTKNIQVIAGSQRLNVCIFCDAVALVCEKSLF